MKKPSVLSGILCGLLAWLLVCGVLVWKWSQIPPQFPLFYSLPWGESWLIAKAHLWLVLTGLAVIWVVNNLLAMVSRDENLLGMYLVWGGAIVEVLFAITVLRTLFIIL